MIQKFLKITSIGGVQNGKNGPYMQVTFEPKYMLSDGTPVACAISEGKRTVFGPSEIGGKEVKADGLFKGIIEGVYKVGSLIGGQIARVRTSPYQIPGREKPVTQWTGIVFEEENAIDYVNKQFAGKVPACAMNGDTLTAPENLNIPLTVNAGKFNEVEV